MTSKSMSRSERIRAAHKRNAAAKGGMSDSERERLNIERADARMVGDWTKVERLNEILQSS